MKRLPSFGSAPTVKVEATPLTIFLANTETQRLVSRAARKGMNYEIVWKKDRDQSIHRAYIVKPVVRTYDMQVKIEFYLKGVIDGARYGKSTSARA